MKTAVDAEFESIWNSLTAGTQPPLSRLKAIQESIHATTTSTATAKLIVASTPSATVEKGVVGVDAGPETASTTNAEKALDIITISS